MATKPKKSSLTFDDSGQSSLISAELVTLEEPSEDRALRPKRLADYVGQELLKRQLGVYLTAARHRKEALDHVLLFGPPGLGKTTLSQIIAAELGVNLRTVAGPTLEKPGDLAAILTQLQENDVLFIDEIHRMPPIVEEVLYPAMEDFKLDIVVGSGEETRAITVPLPQFTLVGATTRAGSLTAPLRDRFGITGRLEYYSAEELTLIVARSSALLGITIDEDACLELAQRSRGTPRIANRLLRRVRDYALVLGTKPGVVTAKDSKEALDMVGVDCLGLDQLDRRLLSAIITVFNGGPVGLSTLAASIGESVDTIESAVEPFLLQQGLIHRTPRGRITTLAALEHYAKTKSS